MLLIILFISAIILESERTCAKGLLLVVVIWFTKKYDVLKVKSKIPIKTNSTEIYL